LENPSLNSSGPCHHPSNAMTSKTENFARTYCRALSKEDPNLQNAEIAQNATLVVRKINQK